jgi:putative glycosyltransferase (TIGR04372 family)
MIIYIKQQIDEIKRGGARVFFRKIKNLPAFLISKYMGRYGSMLLWSIIRRLTDFFGISWSYPYYREAKIAYSRYFWKTVKNGNLNEINILANEIASLIYKGLEYEPDNCEMPNILADIKLTLGEINEWSTYSKLAFENREKFRSRILPKELGLRLFNTRSVVTIGFACHWNGLIKARHLGLIPPDKLILILEKNGVPANKHWIKYLSEYVTILDENNSEHTKAISFFEKIVDFAEYIPDPMRIGSKVYTLNGSALALIEHCWDSKDREPLFKLTPEDIEFGKEKLSKLGLAEDDWFACLHVREAGFKGAEYFRDSPVQDYFMAIQAVVNRGGWVIRMGDATMTPLPQMDHVIDYPHSEIRSARMDVILCGLCEFFIATSSGLSSIAMAFGKPITNTNYLPTLALFFSRKDLFLPKLAKNINTGKLLSFSEIFSSPFSFGVHDINYKQLKVQLINNKPEEIKEVVEEMMDKISCTFNSNKRDHYLQATFKAMTVDVGTLYEVEDMPLNCQIGTLFLRRYSHLLPADK